MVFKSGSLQGSAVLFGKQKYRYNSFLRKSLIAGLQTSPISIFFVLGCFVLPCYLVTLHSLGFSELSRCVGKLCLAVITLVNKFVMLVPVETVPVLGKGPVRVENQVSFFFVCLKKKKSKEMSSSICLSVSLVTTAAQSP